MRTIHPSTMKSLASDEPDEKAGGEWVDTIIWQGVFGGRIEDEQHATGVFEAHVKTVIDTIPAHRLLVMDDCYDWPALCGFLGCAVPQEPYPVSNSTEEFLSGGGAAGN